MKKAACLTMLAVLGLVAFGHAAQANPVEGPIGLVTGAGGGSFGGLGVTFGGSGSNDLVSIDPMTGVTSVVGTGLPSGLHNFAATLDAAGSRYFYRTGGNLIVVDTQTGALLAMLPVPDNLLSISTLFSFPVAAVIDIKPGSDPNSINVKSRGKIAVAILTTDTLDATSVDPATVLFGRTGTEAAPVHFALENVDGDEDTDMVLHFNTWATGIQCGDTSASLTGETFSGQMIQGSDSIKTAGCK